MLRCDISDNSLHTWVNNVLIELPDKKRNVTLKVKPMIIKMHVFSQFSKMDILVLIKPFIVKFNLFQKDSLLFT